MKSGNPSTTPSPSLRLRVLAPVLLTFTAWLPLSANPTAVERFVQKLIDEEKIPGAVVYVAKNGDTLLHTAMGFRDKRHKLPMQTETICWGASIMKPVTVATFMTLVESGLVELDDRVEEYLPQFKHQTGPNNRRYPITIRQLMTHSSGLGDPVSRIRIWPRYSALHPTWLREKLPDIVDAIAESRLKYPPGTDVRYSNAGFFVLARIAEVVTDRSWPKLVAEHILEPLQMNDSTFWPATEPNRVAQGYNLEADGTLSEIWRFDPSSVEAVTNHAADGGLFYTAEDYGRFLGMFIEKSGPLSRQSIDAMLTEQASGRDGTYGLGWKFEDSTFRHGGSGGTFVFGHPESGLHGVFFFQSRMSDVEAKESLRNAFVEVCLETFN